MRGLQYGTISSLGEEEVDEQDSNKDDDSKEDEASS